MKNRYFFLLLLLIPGAVAVAQEKALSSHDFAYGIPLEVDGDGAIYSLPVPQEVYRFTVRRDLGDVRIFNGYGEVVPHLLRREEGFRSVEHEPLDLRFFPLYRDEPWEEEIKHIRIADDDKGTIIDIDRATEAGESSPEPVTHYLIDASSFEVPIEKLLLGWGDTGKGFLVSVKLEYSTDLVHWHHLIAEATLADLVHEGYRLRQQTIALPSHEARYYRLSWPLGEKGLLLDSVKAVPRPATEQRPYQWLPLSASVSDKQGDYRFSVPGHYPVERIRVTLPQSNTVVRVRLYSRGEEPDGAWRLRYQGLLYTLVRDGHTLQNEDIQVTGMSDRNWRLEVVQDGGGLGRGLPQLQMGWVPHRLLFVARGEMPFTLAFGAATVEPPASDMAGLLARLESRPEETGFIKLAHAGGLFELGGENRLSPPAPPLPWKRWLLWAVLVFGVAVLAWMGRSLYRQMNAG